MDELDKPVEVFGCDLDMVISCMHKLTRLPRVDIPIRSSGQSSRHSGQESRQTTR